MRTRPTSTSHISRQPQIWLYLHFPLLPLEALTEAVCEESVNQLPQPRVVLNTGNSNSVLCSNALAEESGIEPGLSLSTALALCPELKVISRQPEQEQAALNRLALLAYHFSSTVILAPVDGHDKEVLHGLWLELSSSKLLFNGYQNLLMQLQSRLNSQFITVRAGIGLSPPAARALCRSAFPNQVLPPQQLQQQLAEAPLEKIELSRKQRHYFAQLGLRTAGDLLALPLPSLGRRFGVELLQQLRQLKGELPCHYHLFQPPDIFRDSLQNPDGIRHKQGLLFPMKVLLQNLCHYLIARQRHCSAIEWRFEPLLGDASVMVVTLSSSQNHWSTLLTLSRLQLERLSLPGSIERIVLHSDKFTEAPVNCLDLFGDSCPSETDILMDMLCARLGADALMQPVVVDDYLPELASTLHHTDSGTHPTTIETVSSAPQPLWLLHRPLPVRQQNAELFWREPLKILRGPERLHGNWWQQDNALYQRDYYLAMDTSGARYWLFREQQNKQWFVHGVFA